VLKPLASWNSNLQVWITEQESLFSEHSELFQAVFPKSGMTAVGRLFELQTQGRLINESESLSSPVQVFNTLTTASNGRSPAFRGNANPNPYEFVEDSKKQGLLPTPKARDSIAEGYESGLRRSSPQVGTIVKGLVAGDDRVLFRTPTTTNATSGAVSESAAIQRGTTVKTQDQIAELAFDNGLKVPNSIVEQLTLIPTTRVSMAKGATAREVAEGNPKSRIEAEVLLGETNWGKFTAAIERWEQVIGRKAPAPTKADGKDGSHRLSSLFTEWLMGLPEGHITGHNLSRADELKMAGNGVVPQQAELALRFLIDDDNFK